MNTKLCFFAINEGHFTKTVMNAIHKFTIPKFQMNYLERQHLEQSTMRGKHKHGGAVPCLKKHTRTFWRLLKHADPTLHTLLGLCPRVLCFIWTGTARDKSALKRHRNIFKYFKKDFRSFEMESFSLFDY